MDNNDKINLVLDSSILRQDYEFRTFGSHQLGKLMKSQKVQLYITDIIKREVLTGKLSQKKEVINEVFSKLKKLSREVEEETEKEILHDVEKSMKMLEEKFLMSYQERFERWLILNRVIVLQETEKYTNLVFDSYFSGSVPFSTPKARDDIPDAFIYYSVLDLSKTLNKVFFCTNDTQLANFFKNQENIHVIKSLQEFIDLDICQVRLEQMQNKKRQSSKLEENRGKNIDRIIEYLNKDFDPKILEEALEEELEFKQIEWENFDAEITELSGIDEFDLKSNFWGNSDEYYASFEAIIRVKIEYKISKQDYYNQPHGWRDDNIILKQNETDYHVRSDVELEIDGELTIKLSESSNSIDLLTENVLSDLKIEALISEAEISLFINNIYWTHEQE